MQSFFKQIEEDVFVGNESARGPWYEHATHGGPAAGLAARMAECVVPGKQLVRLTLDLMRPVPVAGVRALATVTREGRNTAATEVVLSDLDGKPVAMGTTLHLSSGEFDAFPTVDRLSPSLADTTVVDHFLGGSAHGKTGFGEAVDVALPNGKEKVPGPKTIWMRAPGIVDGETPSPFQKLCPIGDCGNGISANGKFGTASFVNPDLTIVMHRAPVGDWMASEAHSHWQPTGIGMSHAYLFDEKGPVGTAIQTLIVRPVF